MKFVPLGTTGATVSRVCLGCMSFGDASKGREWVLDLDLSRPIVRAAWEAGINFYDTADGYGHGKCEEQWGEILRSRRRQDYVLATKLFFPMSDNINDRGEIAGFSVDQDGNFSALLWPNQNAAQP